MVDGDYLAEIAFPPAMGLLPVKDVALPGNRFAQVKVRWVGDFVNLDRVAEGIDAQLAVHPEASRTGWMSTSLMVGSR